MIILRGPPNLTVGVSESSALFYVNLVAGHLSDGPYVIQPATGQVFAVCRFFEDNYQAFIGGSVEEDDSTHAFRWSNIGVGA